MKRRPLDVWFIDHVLPLEAALERFLRRHAPAGEDVADARQEVYVRVYDAARKSLPLVIKPFVFMTARNLLRDRARRARIVSIEAIADLESLNVIAEDISAERVVSGREELRRLQEALDQLPPRCREVIVLRKIHGVPQRQVAAQLGITEDTVERHVSNGVRALAAALSRWTIKGDTGQQAAPKLRQDDRQ